MPDPIPVVSDTDDETRKELARLVQNLQLETDTAEVCRRINRVLTEGDGDLLSIYLARAESEVQSAREDEDLGEKEEAVLRMLREHDDPVSASDAARLAAEDGEFPEVGEAHRSLRHRSHISSVLNDLVDAGYLGKLRHGGSIYYVEPKEAIRRWIVDHGDPDELPVNQIAEETGLPLPTVIDLLDEF